MKINDIPLYELNKFLESKNITESDIEKLFKTKVENYSKRKNYNILKSIGLYDEFVSYLLEKYKPLGLDVGLDIKEIFFISVMQNGKINEKNCYMFIHLERGSIDIGYSTQVMIGVEGYTSDIDKSITKLQLLKKISEIYK